MNDLTIGLCPPGPVRVGTRVEVRAATTSSPETPACVEAVDAAGTRLVWSGPIGRLSGKDRGIRVEARVPGSLTVRILAAGFEAERVVTAEPVDALPRLDGAWVDLYHHSEPEGRPFNADLAKLANDDWIEVVDAMGASGQSTVVVTAGFHNYVHRTEHDFTPSTYPGHALYPSRLTDRRWPIAAEDPIEVILGAADERGMNVFLGIGFYAFFDFTAGSLEWCLSVLHEMWERYGHHPSLYGWYLAHEQCGGLFTPGFGEPDVQRAEMIDFFRVFTAEVRRLTPDKFVMLATNPFGMRGAEEAYRALLPHLDVVVPFGFHRMPEGDLSEPEAIAFLTGLCDEASAHLWADLETFRWPLVDGAELRPRRIEEVIDDLQRFRGFEAVLHYQFPGLMASTAMRVKPGGQEAVALYEDYLAYTRGGRQKPTKESATPLGGTSGAVGVSPAP